MQLLLLLAGASKQTAATSPIGLLEVLQPFLFLPLFTQVLGSSRKFAGKEKAGVSKLGFSHCAAYQSASIKCFIKAHGTFCGSPADTDSQKVSA
jgi:hypothetical protein